MKSRAEFDRFLQLYGIPPSDDKYNQYKKSQSSLLVNEQWKSLSSQVKQPLTKPSKPSLTIDPSSSTQGLVNQAKMTKYQNDLNIYNKQQNQISQGRTQLQGIIQRGFKSKLAYYDEQEEKAKAEKKTKTSPIFRPIKKPEVPTSTGLTPRGKAEKNQYDRFQKQQAWKHEHPGQPLPKDISGDIRSLTKQQEDDSIKYQKAHPNQPIPPPKTTPPHIPQASTHRLPQTNKHINHNIMTAKQFHNFDINQGFSGNQAEYFHYLRQYGVTNPTQYMAGQLQIHNNKQGSASLAAGHSIEQHHAEHSKKIVNHITNNNVVTPGQIPNAPTPPIIKLHNFNSESPANANVNEHQVETHNLTKQAATQTQAGNRRMIDPPAMTREQQEQAQYAKFQQQQAQGGGGTPIRALQE
tara:strand:- start:5 stop:1231 length:1227 start_codon:yes stop_codon:yes gene_type:complete